MPGRYYEDYEVGDVYQHAVRRTVTETDNVWFSAITHNPQPLHIDEEFARTTLHGTRIVNSLFTLALVVGIGVEDTTFGTTLGNLGFEEVAFPAPVRHGDTIHAETEVVAKRESKSRFPSVVPKVVSSTPMPTTSASVNMLFTIRVPWIVVRANSSSM